MPAELMSLGFSNLTARFGSHIAYPFVDDEQRKALLLSYIAEGLRRNEKCITAVSEYPIELWTEGLQARGIDTRSVIDGQLTVLTPGKLFRGSAGNPIGKASEQIKQILADSNDKWLAARVCTSFNYLYHNAENLRSMIREESEAERILANSTAVMLCTFDASHLHSGVVNLCIRQHSFKTDGNSLIPNAAFRPVDDPEAVLSCLFSAGAFVNPFASLDFTGDTPVIRAGDEMDICTAPEVEELGIDLIRIGHKSIIVDLSRTSFMDASSVKLLLRLAAILKESGGSLAICDPLEPPRKLFQLIQMSDRIPIFLSIEEAEYAVRSTAIHRRRPDLPSL